MPTMASSRRTGSPGPSLFIRSDIIPILQLLSVFFASTTTALHQPITASIDTTKLVLHIDDFASASCPSNFLPPFRNETASGYHHAFQHDILDEPIYLEESRSENIPLSTQSLQRPSTPAEYSNAKTIPSQPVLASAPPIHSRFALAKGLLLNNWQQKHSLLTSDWIHTLLSTTTNNKMEGTGDSAAAEDEATSGFRPGNSKVHVGAAAVALLSLATVMCML